MKKMIQLNFPRRRTPSSFLGLSFQNKQLEGVVLRRSNGSLHVVKRFSARLSLDLLTDDAELAGREILNHLQAAGVRERRCVIALPLKWALTMHTQLPDLPAAELASFLAIEAERGFPTDATALQLATSRFTTPSGEQHATLIGVPRTHVERLESVLRAARLKPVSFSLAVTALQPARSEDAGVIALSVAGDQVDMQITCGDGVAALRSLQGIVDAAGGEPWIHPDLVAREARITLGQLPPDMRASVKQVRIFGSGQQAVQIADEMRQRFQPAGMKTELVETYAADAFGRTIPPGTHVSGAFSLAAWQLVGRNGPFEFLPPRISTLQRLGARYGAGKWRKAAAAAAAVLLFVAGSFGYQQYQLMQLRSEWNRIAPTVRELEAVSAQVSQYRPWFDTSFRCLTILKDLTAAFPEDGSLTAKTVEIRDMRTVICSGNADSYAALARTINQLGSLSGVTNFNYQTRGRNPMQFSFDFQIQREGAR